MTHVPETAPAPTLDQYFLKTRTIPPSNEASKTLYLRLHGDGVSSVVLTDSPPKFLRWHHSPSSTSQARTPGKEIAISWKHADRSFGLVIPAPRRFHAWEEVKIVENGGSEDLVWEKGDDGIEFLKRKEDGAEEGKGWKGWMWCPWVHGHPQLFWVTGMVEKELPTFCERVEIAREWLVPREVSGG